MSHFDQQQAPPPTYPPPPEQAYPPTVPPPPPPQGYPKMEGSAANQQAQAPVETSSRGDGFWKGCCAALCCCCVLDTCF